MEENEISSLETHKLPGYLKAKDGKKEREGEGPLFLFFTIKISAEIKMSIIFACLFKFCASKSDHRGDSLDSRYYICTYLISRYKMRG